MVVSVLPLKQISPLAPTATLNTDPLCVHVKEEEEEDITVMLTLAAIEKGLYLCPLNVCTGSTSTIAVL